MDADKPGLPSMPEIAEIARRAAEAKARLQRVASTVTSKDGAATVTVNASGALQQLTFGPKADQIPRSQLAVSVLATAHRAQAEAAQQLTAVMAPLIGTDSAAMKFLEEQIPAPEVPENDPPATDPQPWDFAPETEEDQPPTSPGRRPSRPVKSRPADDEDDGGDSILQRGW